MMTRKDDVRREGVGKGLTTAFTKGVLHWRYQKTKAFDLDSFANLGIFGQDGDGRAVCLTLEEDADLQKCNEMKMLKMICD